MSDSKAIADASLHLGEFPSLENKTIDQRIQELVDREELRELIARYAHRIAHGFSVADLFTEDGVYIQRMPGQPVREVRTRRAIAELYASWVPGRTDSPKPMIHNHLLSICGDEAAGLCSNEVRMTRNGESLIGSGFYKDRFRRENGRWKFSLRDSTFFHMVPLQKGWVEPE